MQIPFIYYISIRRLAMYPAVKQKTCEIYSEFGCSDRNSQAIASIIDKRGELKDRERVKLALVARNNSVFYRSRLVGTKIALQYLLSSNKRAHG